MFEQKYSMVKSGKNKEKIKILHWALFKKNILHSLVDFWKNNENFHQNLTINLDFDMALEHTIIYLEG